MSYEITAVGDEADEARLAATEEPQDTQVLDNTSAPDETKESTQPTEATQADTPEDKGSDSPEESATEYYFGGEKVEVEVPDDIKASFEEKGLDVTSVVSELFSKEGKFSLSDDTRAKLDEAFGKGLVDAYLNLYKGQNEMAMEKFGREAEAQKAQMETHTKEFNELVGGDEGWENMSLWAADNLSESELSSFNAVMSLPAEHFAAQRMVAEALKTRYQSALKEGQSDQVKLLTDEGEGVSPTNTGLPSQLTRQEFQQLMRSEKYNSDPAYANQIDQIRRASKAKGL